MNEHKNICNCLVCRKIELLQKYANTLDEENRDLIKSVMEEWLNAAEDSDYYKFKYDEIREKYNIK